MFTRQHYKAIAEIVKRNTNLMQSIAAFSKRKDICNDFADYFAKDNPRFDRQKFLEACGLL